MNDVDNHDMNNALDHDSMSDEDMDVVDRINSGQMYISVYDSYIGPEQMKEMAEYIQGNITLFELSIFDSIISNAEVCTLANALAHNTGLYSLDLTQNNISPEGALSIADALCLNTSLSKLDLSNNVLGNEGAWMIAMALAKNALLKCLNLEDNNIETEGVCAIGAALRTNYTLISLRLSSNLIGVEGARALVALLEKNRKLKHLYLSDCDIDPRIFAKVLETNTSLYTLDLSQNRCDNECGNAFEATMNINRTLRSLRIDCKDLHTNVIYDRLLLNHILAMSFKDWVNATLVTVTTLLHKIKMPIPFVRTIVYHAYGYDLFKNMEWKSPNGKTFASDFLYNAYIYDRI